MTLSKCGQDGVKDKSTQKGTKVAETKENYGMVGKQREAFAL